MTAVIEARGVTVRAGRATLLAGIDLEVRAGEVVALLGPNGAGKSTLIGALAGDRGLASGTVRLAGCEVSALSARELAERRAVLRQRSTLAASFTALEVVQLGQAQPDEVAARAQLAAVGLVAFADRVYPSLSGGEQQRVQLARVLAQLSGRPGAALLLDEPAAALDLRQLALVSRLARDAAGRGHAVVAVAHDLDFVARVADRVVVLRAGAVIASGDPAATLTSDVLSRAFEIEIAVERTPRGALAAFMEEHARTPQAGR